MDENNELQTVTDNGETAEIKKPEKKDAGKTLKNILLSSVLPVLLSGIVRALGVYIFTTPNKFAPGGITGISVLLEEGIGWNSGWFLLMLNVPIFFVAFFCLGKREAIVSTCSMLLSSGLLILLKRIPNFPQFNGRETEEPIAYGLLGAVAGGIFLGAALAIMIKSCGTSGGTTVLASLVNKKWRFISVSWLTSLFDALVVFASFFVYYQSGVGLAVNLVPVLLALVSLYVTSKTSDLILHGFKTAYKFEIVTDHPEELAKEILESTHHGVTKIEAMGMYSHQGKSMLVCIIRKRQIAEVQRIIKKYPGTFAYFSQTSEVYGRFAK